MYEPVLVRVAQYEIDAGLDKLHCHVLWETLDKPSRSFWTRNLDWIPETDSTYVCIEGEVPQKPSVRASSPYQSKLDALNSKPPPDGGDKFCEHVIGWPSGDFHVYAYTPFPQSRQYRYVVPQACTDHQIRVLVNAWLEELGYHQPVLDDGL